jgi:hypothetical protein
VQPLLQWDSNKYCILWVCVCVFVALGIQDAVRMRRIAMCGLPRSTSFLPIFSLTIWYFLNVIESKTCVSMFSTTFVWNIFILRRIEKNMIKMSICLHVKYTSFLPDFDENWTLFGSFLKNTRIPNFMKIRPVGAKMFRTDRPTDRHDEANRRFSQFLESA